MKGLLFILKNWIIMKIPRYTILILLFLCVVSIFRIHADIQSYNTLNMRNNLVECLMADPNGLRTCNAIITGTDSTKKYYSYGFQDSNNGVYTGSVEIAKAATEDNNKISIIYLAADPNVSVCTDNYWSAFLAITIFLLVVTMLIVVGIILPIIIYRPFNVFSNCVKANAIITRVESQQCTSKKNNILQTIFNKYRWTHINVDIVSQTGEVIGKSHSITYFINQDKLSNELWTGKEIKILLNTINGKCMIM